jgi:hypothetical protein
MGISNVKFAVFIWVYILFKCKWSIPTLTAAKLVEYGERDPLYPSLLSALQEWGLGTIKKKGKPL